MNESNAIKPNSVYTFTKSVTPLKDLLPLSMPLAVHIDPSNICNFECKFCPTGNHKLLRTVARPKGFMEYALFCKIIDDLVDMSLSTGSKLKRLHLYKDGEPLLNKRLYEMISYAKEKMISESVEITTNGSPLTKQNSINLIRSGLDAIRISVEHVTNEGYKRLVRTYSDYERIVKNVEFLYKNKSGSGLKIHVKIIDIGLTDEEIAKFISDFSEISDSINIDKPMGWSASNMVDWQLGMTVTTAMDGVTPLAKKSVCPEVFSKLAINFDGTVSICCVDWSHGTVVGDVKISNLIQIWNGSILRDFRLLHLNGKRNTVSVCADCQYLDGLPEYSVLDEEVERLRKFYV